MNVRILSAAAVTLIAIFVFATTAYHALVAAPNETEVASTTLAAHAPLQKSGPAGLPSRIMIPSLNIDTNVLQVGIARSGNMAVPPNYSDVGWYKYGTIPGQIGSAVIDGHVDNGLALDGVFKHLAELHIADDVYIITNGGTRLHFVVTDIQTYPFDGVPTDLLFNQDDTSRLNLITCEGAWVQGQKTYDHRLVIFTKLVSA